MDRKMPDCKPGATSPRIDARSPVKRCRFLDHRGFRSEIDLGGGATILLERSLLPRRTTFLAGSGIYRIDVRGLLELSMTLTRRAELIATAKFGFPPNSDIRLEYKRNGDVVEVVARNQGLFGGHTWTMSEISDEDVVALGTIRRRSSHPPQSPLDIDVSAGLPDVIVILFAECISRQIGSDYWNQPGGGP